MNDETKTKDNDPILKHWRLEPVVQDQELSVDALREQCTLMAAPSMVAGFKYILAMTLDPNVSHDELREAAGEVAVRSLIMTGHMKDFMEKVEEFNRGKAN